MSPLKPCKLDIRVPVTTATPVLVNRFDHTSKLPPNRLPALLLIKIGISKILSADLAIKPE
jgi:hypothetical protein